MGEVNVCTEIIIDRPVDQVADWVADPDHAPDWYQNIKTVQWVTEHRVAVGARMAFVAEFLGRELRYTYEIAAWEPGKRLVMRTREGPFPMETTYTWEAVGEGQTRMTLRNRGEPSGFTGMVAPLMARQMRKANEKDLAVLKHMLEGGTVS